MKKGNTDAREPAPRSRHPHPLIGYRGPQKRVGLPLAHAFCVRKCGGRLDRYTRHEFSKKSENRLGPDMHPWVAREILDKKPANRPQNEIVACGDFRK